VGFNKTTGWLYWKTCLRVIAKNPRAIEATINLAAMYIHFYKQSKFVVDLTNNEISLIEKGQKVESNELLFPVNRKSKTYKTSLPEVNQ